LGGADVVWAPIPFTASSNTQSRRVCCDAIRWILSANSFTSLPVADLLSTDTNITGQLRGLICHPVGPQANLLYIRL